ncbi:hormone-sensitive lipase-like [Saccostrea echinata]|uniref:hormone-sensitive lipase-like n=1 Tax=Saccostrea echinata TaxID=191078 RepID=UPI002A81070E|nr:hormone-sensitive lipase-like [Saccostrea echinata]
MARLFNSLFRDLRALSLNNIEFFQHGTSSTHAKFHQSFCMLYEHLDRGIQPSIEQIVPLLPKYDLSADTQANGYRSLLKVVQKCCINLLRLSRYVNANRSSLFFRGNFYSKELEAYVICLGQLRATLYYAQKLVVYSQEGSLFADEDNLNDPVVERLMEEVESLGQNCFYGRCLGFQFCESMHKPLTTVAVAMASFSEGYLEKSNFKQLTTSVIHSGKYFMNPELRAEQIVSVTRTASVEFCKNFWSITESDIMQALPSLVCPAIKVNEVMYLKPESFELPAVNSDNPTDMVTITAPCAHTGPGPVKVRLMSFEPREGQVLRHGNQNPRHRLPMSSSLLIHCHGGGFVAQSSKSHGIYLRQWAKDLNVPILSIDYSLAPEQPFPRALEECFFAYAWAIKNCTKLGWTGETLCLAGDSAGGNLMISTALRAASCGIQIPDGIMTAYPVVLVRYTPSPARILALMDPLLPVGIMMRCLAAYAGIADKVENAIDEPFEIIEADEALHEEDIFNYKDKTGNKGDNFSSMTSSCHSIESVENLDDQDISGQNISNRCHSIESLHALEEPDISSQQSSVLEGICADSDEDITILKTVNRASESSVEEVEHLTTENSEEIILESSEEEDYDIVKPEDISEPTNDDTAVNDFTLPASKSDGHLQQNRPGHSSCVMDLMAGSLTRSNMSGMQHSVSQDSKEKLELDLSMINHQSHSLTHSPSCPEISESLRYGFTGKFTPQYTKEVHKRFSPLQMFRKHPIVKNPYMSPFLAPDEMLKCLPPIKMVACHLDPLLDDSVMFARRLRSLGNQVELYPVDDLPHGFLNFSTASKEARLASDVCVDKIRQILQLST